MRQLLFLLTLALAAFSGMARRSAVVTATYTYYAPESMSVEEAKHIALERAKAEAIASEFGTTVTQSNTVVTTSADGESATRLYSVGGSDVKGEWIETVSDPKYTISYGQGVLTVSVSVRGLINESDLTAPDVEITVYRNAVTHNNESDEFRDGDDFYMTARPVTDGYMVAYLLDEKAHTAYRILPYQQAAEHNVRLKEGGLYTFFSSDGADDMTRSLIDSYTMTCDDKVEFNRLYVLFASNPVSLPSAEIRQGDDMPYEIDESRFYNWLIKKRSGTGVRVVERLLKISGRN